MSIGRNTAVGLATNIAVLGLGILISVVVTRSFGPVQRGVYIILVTTNTLLTTVVHLSVGTACTTLLARGRYRLGEVNTIALILAIALGLVSLAIASLAFPFLRDSIFLNVSYSYLLVALALVPITIYQTYWNAMMIGLNRIVVQNKLSLVLNISNTVFVLTAVGVLRLGIPGFLGAWTLSTLLGALGALIVSSRMERFAWPPSRLVLKDLLSFGLRVHGAGIAHQLFLRFDIFAVNALVGTAGVGFYSLATSLAEKLWIVLDAVASSSNSKIAQLPHTESARLTAKVTRTALLVMIGLGLPFAVVSPWLIPFMYGSAFVASVMPLIILLVGTLGFAGMLVLNNYVLGQMQRPGLLSIISWFELGISIPLYLGLIAWQGIVGAAIASTLTYLIAMVGTLFVFTRDSGLSPAQALLPRRSDFGDYLRVIALMLSRLPFVGRYIHLSRPS